MKIKWLFWLIILIVIAFTITQCAPSTSKSTSLDGRSLVQDRCTACHSLDRIQNAHKSADEWKTTVERMMGKGAQLNLDEQQVVIDYLAKTYPK
jgi:ribosomal protein L17